MSKPKKVGFPGNYTPSSVEQPKMTPAQELLMSMLQRQPGSTGSPYPFNGFNSNVRFIPRSFPTSFRFQRGGARRRRFRRARPGTTKTHYFVNKVTTIYNGTYEDGSKSEIEEVLTIKTTANGQEHIIYAAGGFNMIPEELTDWKTISEGMEDFEVKKLYYDFVPTNTDNTTPEERGELMIVIDKNGFSDVKDLPYSVMVNSPSKRVFKENRKFRIKYKPALFERVKLETKNVDEDLKDVSKDLADESEEEEEEMYRQVYNQTLMIDKNSIKTKYPGFIYGWARPVGRNPRETIRANAGFTITQTAKVYFKRD